MPRVYGRINDYARRKYVSARGGEKKKSLKPYNLTPEICR